MQSAATVTYGLGVVEFYTRSGGVGYLLCLGSTYLHGKTKARDRDCCHDENSTLAEAALSFLSTLMALSTCRPRVTCGYVD